MALFQDCFDRGIRRVGLCAAPLAALILAACSAGDEGSGYSEVRANVPRQQPTVATTQSAMQNIDAAPRVKDANARAPISTAADAGRPVVSLKLLGTSIDGADRLAVIRTSDLGTMKVREGDDIEGFAITGIQADHVELRTREDGRRLALPLDADPSTPAIAGDFDPAPYTGPITYGVNTDQTLPEHPTLGPTASLPEGIRQIGH